MLLTFLSFWYHIIHMFLFDGAQVSETLFIFPYLFISSSSNWIISIDLPSGSLFSLLPSCICCWTSLVNFSFHFLYFTTQISLDSLLFSVSVLIFYTWWGIVLILQFFRHRVSFSFLNIFQITYLKSLSSESSVSASSGTVSVDYFFLVYEPYFHVSLHIT